MQSLPCKNSGISFVSQFVLKLSCFYFSLNCLTYFFLKLLPGRYIEENGFARGFQTGFADFVMNNFKLNYGLSWSHPGTEVTALIAQAFKNTFLLNLICLMVVFWGGLFLAYAASYTKPHTKKIFNFVILLLISMPVILITPSLILLFSFYLKLLPAQGLISPMHYILPIFCLSLRPMAIWAHLNKNFFLEFKSQPQYLFLKAKGILKTRIMFRHLFPQSIIQAWGGWIGLCIQILLGNFIIEILFSIQGLAFRIVDSMQSRDLPMLSGLILFSGILIYAIHLFSNFVAGRFDARTASLVS